MHYLHLSEPDVEFGIGIRDEDTGEYQPRISNMGKIQRTTITGYDQREPMVVYGHVRSVAPCDTHSILPSTISVERKTSTEGSIDIGFAGPTAGVKAGYEITRSGDVRSSIVINGSPCSYYSLGEHSGDPDRCNAVEWHIFENAAQKSGLPSFFQTAVLLERRAGDDEQFTASFDMRTEVDTVTDAKTRLKKAFGFIPRDDAVIFDPNVKEDSRFDEYAGKLDKVGLDRECSFVMYKDALA